MLLTMKENMKTFGVILSTYAMIIPLINPLFAGEMRQGTNKEMRKEIKKEIREEVKEKLKARGYHGEVNGTIGAISANTITVTKKEGGSVTINISDTTKLYLKFTGTATLSNFAVGDLIGASGKWANDEKTSLDAAWVRNKSVSRRGSNFYGTITSIGTNSFVLQPKVRANAQTVNVIANTKYIDKKGNAITFADLKVGDEVKVNGSTWDRTSKTINEAIKVVDRSIPR